jgi:hypothetical protein
VTLEDVVERRVLGTSRLFEATEAAGSGSDKDSGEGRRSEVAAQ